ncbi:MAG: T9SS type A sorting domain-containing protein [Chitinophagales bacterium]|nr:T9SS type A sorting domain-containing protein [Chitinophagales bacterium]
MFRNYLLIVILLLSSGIAYSSVDEDINLELISGEYFHYDHNQCYLNIGPRAAYVGIVVENIGDSTYHNLTVTLSHFTTIGYGLAGGQLPILNVKDSLATGAKDTLFWFCTYPCGVNQTQIVFMVSDIGSHFFFLDTTPIIKNKREISASSGGFIYTNTLSSFDTANQQICFNAKFGFSKLDSTDLIFIQPVANLSFNAFCFQLESAQVLSSQDSSMGCIPLGYTGMFFDVDEKCGLPPAWEIEVEFCFSIRCHNQITSVIPYASTISGRDLKYSIADEIVNLVLPIDLSYFKVDAIDNNAKIEWQTLSEANTSYYEIEKSIDGINFYSIGTVNASGFSSEPLTYNFYDFNINNINYYRLKTNYLDNTSEYSEIILLKGGQQNTITNVQFYPNPTKDFITLHTNNTANKIVDVYLLDAVGNVKDLVQLNQDSKTINLSQYQKGLYFLQYQVDGQNKTEKLLIN